MSDRVPMTKRGHQMLKAELEHLKRVVRPQTSREIEEARAHGDLKENAEYHAAKEKQGFVEGRIMEIESKLTLAEVIDPSKLSGTRIVFGAHVTVIDADEEERTYQIVGVDEADTKKNKISVTAPFARGMIGKSVGDPFEVKSPRGGSRDYEVVAVEYRDE